MSQSHVQLLETQVNVQLFTTSSFFCLKRWILLCKAKKGKKSFLSKLISFDEITQRCLCLSQTLNGLILSSAETVDTDLPQVGWKWWAKGMETLRNPKEELGKISRDNYHILKILWKYKQTMEELQNSRVVQRAGKIVRTVRSKCLHNTCWGFVFQV